MSSTANNSGPDVLPSASIREQLDLFGRAVDDERLRLGLNKTELARRSFPGVTKYRLTLLLGGEINPRHTDVEFLARVAAGLGGKLLLRLELPPE